MFRDWREHFQLDQPEPGKLRPAEDRGTLVLTGSSRLFGSPPTFFTFFQIMQSDAW